MKRPPLKRYSIKSPALKSFKRRFLFLLPVFFGIVMAFSACSDEEEPPVRHEDDIMGVWTDGSGRYINFKTMTKAYNLYVSSQDGETIGYWEHDGYLYEPGYQIVLYMDNSLHPMVYKVVELTEKELVWCWVEDLREDYAGQESVGEIMGQLIKDAQEGWDLNPDDYEYFSSVSEDDFLNLINSLSLELPW